MKKIRFRRISVFVLAVMIVACLGPLFSEPVMAAERADANSGTTSYFAVENKIYSIKNNSSGTTKKIKTLSKPKKYTGGVFVDDISYYKGYLYFETNYWIGSDGGVTYICRIKKNGTGFKKLAVGYDPQVYGGRLYYSNNSGIMSMKLNGKGKKRLLNTTVYVDDMQVIGGHIY